MATSLTVKQSKFIDYYIELGNATEAAVKAGYSKKTADVIAAQNLIKLRKYIDIKMQSKEDARIATQDEVLRFLTSILRNEETEEIIVVEGCGVGESEARKIDKAIAAKDRIKAAELLGKRYGSFEQIIDNSDPIEIILRRE